MKHVVERLSRDAVTAEDSHHVQQTAARRQQVVYMIRRTQSIIECNGRTLAQLTRSMFRHSGGGWDDWPYFSRMKISSFDFVNVGAACSSFVITEFVCVV